MTTTSEPRARVEAFIADWHQQWQRVDFRAGEGGLDDIRSMKPFDFDGWKKTIQEVDARHFVAGAGCGSQGSFSSEPDHDPAQEKVLSEVKDGAEVVIETRGGSPHITRFHEYHLVNAGGDWRIAKLVSFSHSSDEPFVKPDKRAALVASPRPDAPLAPLAEPVGPALDHLFEPGRQVQLGDETVTPEVRSLGSLHTASGALVVRDLGYDSSSDLRPLARSISPGSYPVEIVVADRRVAAVRVVIANGGKASAWHPADMTSGGHVAGVDAGNIGIVDLGAMVALSARGLERSYQRNVVDATEQPLAHVFSIDSSQQRDGATEGDAVVVQSGYGDGAYPVYWGVGERGEVTVLVVDFQVLTAPADE